MSPAGHRLLNLWAFLLIFPHAWNVLSIFFIQWIPLGLRCYAQALDQKSLTQPTGRPSRLVLQALVVCVCVCTITQSCLTLCDPMDCSPPAQRSKGFSGQEYWVGCCFLLQGIFTVLIIPRSAFLDKQWVLGEQGHLISESLTPNGMPGTWQKFNKCQANELII